MPTIKVTQIKSGIDRPKRVKDTLQSLGLGKLHKSVTISLNPAILGQVKSVSHLVTIELVQE